METSIPFSILTGFLGAGKTTTLNRLLSAPLGRRIAVLVNELGRIAIDSRLILSRGGDVLELAGGCVCCRIDVKNDLWDGIADVIRRSAPDHVVLETTGIAEPAAILEGIGRLAEEGRSLVEVAGVICVVDAEAGSAQLARREEAREQVMAADRLLLSKLDLAAAPAAAALHEDLAAMNPRAEIAAFPAGEDGTRALAHWLLEHRRPMAVPVREHRHPQIAAATFSCDAPLLAAPLLALVDRVRPHLLRVKGFVHIADNPGRGFLELAGERMSLTFAESWAGEVPRTELVLIGEDLDEAALRRQLWACRLGA